MSVEKKKPTLRPLETVEVVETQSQCLKAMERIMNDCNEWYMVGLYCEWNHQLRRGAPGSKMGKVLIVSICTYLGYCAVFRIDKLGSMPTSLKDLLESDKIGKCGVITVNVAKHLSADYGVRLRKYGDVYEACIYDKTFSNPVTKEVQKFAMDRNCTDFNHTKWSDQKLSPYYTTVAAAHVYRCLELREKFDPNWFLSDMSYKVFETEQNKNES